MTALETSAVPRGMQAFTDKDDSLKKPKDACQGSDLCNYKYNKQKEMGGTSPSCQPILRSILLPTLLSSMARSAVITS